MICVGIEYLVGGVRLTRSKLHLRCGLARGVKAGSLNSKLIHSARSLFDHSRGPSFQPLLIREVLIIPMMNRRKKANKRKGKWEEEEEHRGGEDKQRYAIE
jgi:hypothetical protein